MCQSQSPVPPAEMPPTWKWAQGSHLVKGCNALAQTTGYFLWWPGDWPYAVIGRFMESLLRSWLGLDPDCMSDADLALLRTRGIVSHGTFHPFLQPRVKCCIWGNVAFQSTQVQIWTKW